MSTTTTTTAADPPAAAASHRAPTDPALTHYLADHDAPCPSCGYNVRGLTGSTCPECNSELALRVGLVEPRLGAYITGLIGWSLGAGLNGLLVVYLILVVNFSGIGGPPLHPFLTHNLVGGAIHAAAILTWVLAGRRLRRLGWGPRWALATTGWIASLVNIVIFALIIR